VTDARQQIPVTPQHIKISRDSTTGATTTIDYAHHELHASSSFTADYTVELANGATIDILVITPNTTKWAHMEYILMVELETEMKIYEGPTTTNDGTGLTEFNRDRNSSTAATTVVSHTPTIAGGSEGTLIRTKHIGAGKTAGGESRDLSEFILKQNTKYLYRITNATSSVNWITFILSWYEHTNR